MPLKTAANAESVQREAGSPAFIVDDVPAFHAGWVRSRTLLQDTGQYLIEVDPGWVSGKRKGQVDALAHLDRAGYKNPREVTQQSG